MAGSAPQGTATPCWRSAIPSCRDPNVEQAHSSNDCGGPDSETCDAGPAGETAESLQQNGRRNYQVGSKQVPHVNQQS